jgi:DNA-binding MarR family transcriptional regulator
MPKSTGRANGHTRQSEDTEITLGVLSAIEADSAISQRTLSNELGVALGLANAYLKRCVRKGYIKIQQVPRRRYTYYLTPQGFAEKARLTGEYLSSSLQFFRRSRTQINEIMSECTSRGWRRIALAGASDIAEIATITSHDHDVVLVGVIDGATEKSRFCGLPVVKRLKELGTVDAVILTRSDDGGTLRAVLAEEIGADRVLAPKLVELAQMRRPPRRNPRTQSQSAGDGRSKD